MTDEVDNSQVEQEARALGWVPQDKYKGNPDKWVDAEEFVERGKSLMPLLRQNNERLKQDRLQLTAKIGTLEDKLNGATVALDRLEKHYTEANRRSVEIAKAQLKAELKQAREDDDVDAEERILGQLGDIQEAERAAKAQPPEKKDPPSQPSGQQPDPIFVEWQQDNPWFGPDKKKTKAVARIAEDLREEGSELSGREFMDECVRLYEQQQNPSQEEPPVRSSKVEGGTQPRGNTGAGKSFASLPKEAKQACWDDVDDLVGPNKRYKTQKDWENAYAKLYHGEE
jgi:hypothetical protein